MALSTRAAIDPRWVFHQRPVAVSTQLLRGVLLRPHQVAGTTWTPLEDNPVLRTPGAPVTYTELYRGTARVQSGQDFRSRKQSLRDENLTENTFRVQLDYSGNELRDSGDQPLSVPDIRPSDVFRVTEVGELDGVQIEPQLLHTPLIVRTISMSSNSWVINLLCDVDQNKSVSTYA